MIYVANVANVANVADVADVADDDTYSFLYYPIFL